MPHRNSIAAALRRTALATSLALCASAHAGDILRGGSPIANTRTHAGAGSNAGADAAAKTQASAKDRLSRTTAALDAVKTMQAAARKAASGAARIHDPNRPGKFLPRVKDGLGKNGLQIDPLVPKNLNKPKPGENPALWVGAKLPTQTSGKDGSKNVTIVQTDQQALLNWRTFHIGKKTSLYFDQSQGGSDKSKWIAFNKINDPTGRPSQILGSLKSDGQVYVINQNGIIFGGVSQVNTHTLVASSLPINDKLVVSGLLNSSTGAFLFDSQREDDIGDGILANQSAELSQIIDGRDPVRIVASVTTTETGGSPTTADIKLAAGKDYNLVIDAERHPTVVLTDAGKAKTMGDGDPSVTVQLQSMSASYFALSGDVTIQPGAQISSPTSAAKVGGRVMLVGANVENKGTISTPDGQAILAAGLQVGIASHSSDDPSLRGLDIFVGAVGDSASKRASYAGTATNSGLIDVPRANATIAGKSVQQNGIIDSRTTVSLNGRIDLDATYDAIINPFYDVNGPSDAYKVLFVPKSTGTVTFGKGSVMRILPELSSDEQATGEEVAIRSQINVRGLAIHFDKGSSLLAPNAKVSVNAGGWNFIPASTALPPISEFVHAAGKVYIDDGALLDVAGTTNVSVPQSDNILTVELRGSELADSPLQRDGAIRGISLTIDARQTGTFNGKEWIGTPLGDATGFLGLIQHGVGPLMTKGGEINLQAGDSVVLNRGAILDVSGGWQRNEGGFIKTTKLTQGSRLVDIADATPDQVYDGIYDPKFTQTHSKWGVTKTYRNPFDLNGGHFEDSYIQGAAGGSISIIAPSVALDGKLAGTTVTGPKQTRLNPTSSSLPAASKLALTFRADDPDPQYGEDYSAISLHAPKVVFDDSVQVKALPFALDAEGNPLALKGDVASNLINPFQLRTIRRDTVVLSPSLLTDSGFGDLTVDNAAGDISVPAGIALAAAVESSITLNGRNIDVQGSITAPGGSLSLTANNRSPYLIDQFKNRSATDPAAPLFADPLAGRFTLGSSGSLSTAGLTVDDRNSLTADDLLPIVTKGGNIDIAAYTARLAAGSVVDVSGGVFVDSSTDVSYGAAGAISIRAGKDPHLAALFPQPLNRTVTLTDRLLGGRLNLGGELRGYSGAKGGSLTLQAPFIQIGGLRNASTAPGTFFLRPEFFDQGGFTSFDLSGIGGARFAAGQKLEDLPGLVIAANTVIAPRATSLFADPRPTDGGNLAITHTIQPRAERAPVSLAFHSLGMSDEALNVSGNIGIVFRGDLVMQEGAIIRTDPRASVSFSGDTVAILGQVDAPAGAISIKGGSDSIKIFKQDVAQAVAMPTVYLGSESRLSAAGTRVFMPDPFGRRVGTVLPGGTIDVSGNIVAAAGSVLDVSGASGMLDFSPLALDPAASPQISVRSGITEPLQNLQSVAVRVDSDGGAITLHGGEMLFTDATLLGRAGGPTSLGGTLDVSSGRFSPLGLLPTAANLIVTQGNRTIPLAPLPSIFQPGEQTAIGKPVVDRDAENVPALGYFAADKFLEGGFDSLTLGGVVRFKGPVSIDARGSLKVADGGVLYADDHVNLSASYVALGTAFEAPLLPSDPKSPFTVPTNPYNFSPTHGPGVLTVKADLIDIGTLSLRNMRLANFVAEDGDIRGSGTLNIAGRLRFEAGQIYTPTALSFTAVAYDYASSDHKPGDPLKSGSIVIKSSGSRQLPLSAGGTLSFYASNIEQSGVLRAPMGTINLGWDGTGTAPVDLIAGAGRFVPVTQKLLLGAGSITSVSAVDPTTGEGLLIPYGVSLDGNSWIDPTSIDVTNGGLPTKNVNLSASRIVTKSTSEIDLRGGGDLYAYRWVAGNGGTQDILASDTNFAVLPGYQASFAPLGAYNDTASITAFNSDSLDATTRDAGYINKTLAVGDRVYLGASAGLAAGYYTLLPARYALLPGASLVTAKAGSTLGTLAMPDGSAMVSGYRFNGLDSSRVSPSIYSQFEVVPRDVVRARVEYEDFSANRFLRDSALATNSTPQTLPFDSGHLVFKATEAMRLNGAVRGEAPFGGRGAFIDVSSPRDIIIAGADAKLSKSQTKDAIVLNSAKLSGWGAESLMIGGLRETTDDGTSIAVQTGNLTVDNAGSPLSAPEIILVANDTLTLAPHAEIAQSGNLTGHADTLLLDGDGTLLRVSSDQDATFTRLNATSSHVPRMTIGAGASLTGASLTIDSTYATNLSSKAILRGRAINLSSGQISLSLNNPGDLQPTDGLVLAGRALRSLRGAESLSLLSYSSIDIYGSGEVGTPELRELGLHAGEIRGFNNGAGVEFRANHVLLDNRANVRGPGAIANSSGSLKFRVRTVELGNHRMAIDQFANVNLTAPGGILIGGKGKLFVDGDLNVRTPEFFAAGGATEIIRATGGLEVRDSGTKASADLASGVGASLTLQGASVTVNSDIFLPSGQLTLQASTGNVNVNGRLDVGGTAQAFNDLIKYIGAGEISLLSGNGDVNLGKRGTLSVAAQKGGGDAGSLSIAASEGSVKLAGTLLGKGGAHGRNGTFSLDVGLLPELAKLSSVLDEASFGESRSFRVRHGDVLVNGSSTVRNFRLSADAGSIFVTGKVDASGATGGTISMIASGSLVLDVGSLLDASGKDFSNAGKGGAITLEAGSQVDGMIDSSALLDIRSGSRIDLSVAGARPDSADYGRFTGTLHLRAPQTAAGTDLQLAAIDGAIKGASSIIVEGYKLYDLTATDGNLTGTPLQTLKNNIMANGNLFAGAAGTTTATYAAMLARLLANNPALDAVLSLRPGVEIIHRTGSITFGITTATTSTNANDTLNFSSFRFGPKSAPGVLTLRAAGNLVFNVALTDGFAIRTPVTGNALTTDDVYQAPLMDANPLLPLNAQSWSYRIAAGADFSGADYRAVLALQSLGADLGSLKLGRNVVKSTSGSADALTSTLVKNRYQVIRTGSGDIDISTGRDVQLLNQFATIYTAGTKINDPTLGGTFDLPYLSLSDQGDTLGAVQQQETVYPVQFSLGGGDVTIHAQGNITHLTRLTSTGPLVADSERQLPVNWLYRRGFVDPTTGAFGKTPQRIPLSGGTMLVGGDVTSTAWWVDFSNFFEGIGALGGGNVTLVAGHDVSNVDAVVPTNARLSKNATSADQLVEVGGGDVTVRAGHNLDAGVYYVERGTGILSGGNDIVTNSTRSPSIAAFRTAALPATSTPGEQAWLPTTLFLGKGSFDVSARGDVLLGPVANVFLLPEGLDNSIWYKTYFSTYAANSSVNVSSLGGSVTLRTRAALPGSGATTSLLQAWLRTQLVLVTSSSPTASFFQPWLRINETNVDAFATVASILPPVLRATAFTGDLDLVGTFNLFPSRRGTVEFAAAGAINGLQPTGGIISSGQSLVTWGTTQIDISDADPSAIPGVVDPYAYRAFIGPLGDRAGIASGTEPGYLLFIDRLFAETGALDSVMQTKQTLHAGGLLHEGDSSPVRLYAAAGDISGITLFSPKATRIIAGQDITDNAFYIQNLDEDDISIVAAGRNLTAYNANSPLRTLSQAAGNLPPGTTKTPEAPLAGDIQVSGPGTLEVFAGGNLDLGTGATNADGTASGITTVGNTRNPYLPFDGARIIAAAGIGPSNGLSGSTFDFETFIDTFVLGDSGEKYLAEIDPLLTPAAFEKLSQERRDAIALDAFYLILRDAGRAHTADGTGGGYDTGYEAIASLFPAIETESGAPVHGDITTRARDIRTKNGGDIDLLIPRGELTLASSTIGNPLVPPGIITESGGNISIFADKDVDIGIGRIFTLRGGNEIIWSSTGDIAAGAAAKTVKSAPPTRVLIDPQSADVQTDLAGLSTGGGIGVLATVAGVAPGDVDLIAPVGVVDAGDAGIRVSGNLNIAATRVLNADNIAVVGKTTGVPTAPVVAAPNIAGLTNASNTAGAANSAAESVAKQAHQQAAPEETPSIIDVEVVGYGGGNDSASL